MNKQITEDFVSYEIAKLLKEKGFDEFTFSNYNENGIFQFNEVETRIAKGYQRPTHQMALKWLREGYNIFIEINVSIDLNGAYHYAYYILDKECKYIKRFVGYYSTHKLCVEAALDYVLKNLI